jgi:hypothetical protein
VTAIPATTAPENTPQAALPFAADELLRVRVRPADFARMIGVDKSTITRWIQRNVITLGTDGRINPEQAMRQLLRNADPGRTRARLVRRAFGDLGDLRARAAQAAVLEEQLRDLMRQAQDASNSAAFDYDRVSSWLDRFEASVVAIPQRDRSAMDALEWRTHVRGLLLRVMDDGIDSFGEIETQLAASVDSALTEIAGGGAA